MAKYRYARSNGEFLASEFIENVQPASDDDFTQLEAYNLTKKFVSGSTIDARNSYPSDQELTSYSPSGLQGWWRLGKGATDTIGDSSGNEHTAVPPTTAATPVRSPGQTPGVYVQSDSLKFEKSGASASQLVVSDSSSFSFDGSARPSPRCLLYTSPSPRD